MTSTKISFNDFRAFHKAHSDIAATIWTGAMVFSVFLSLIDLTTAIAMFFISGGAMTAFMVQQEKSLLERMNASGGGKELRFMVNDVSVGVIYDANYASIQHAVWFDVRTYFSQILNLLGVAINWITLIARTIPVLFFWIAAGCYLVSPGTFGEIVNSINARGAEDILEAWPNFIVLFGTSIAMAAALAYSCGLRLGLINRFDEKTNETLRRFFKCPADGKVDLYLAKENGVVG